MQKLSLKNHIQFYSTKRILAHNLNCQRFPIDKPHIMLPLDLFSQAIPRNSHIKDITMNKCHYRAFQMWNNHLSRSKKLENYFKKNEYAIFLWKKQKKFTKTHLIVSWRHWTDIHKRTKHYLSKTLTASNEKLRRFHDLKSWKKTNLYWKHSITLILWVWVRLSSRCNANQWRTWIRWKKNHD